ncbi:MAG TPA: SRPBCC family protein [Thermoanaerobaculia bacterium]|nr:SRPBCC family protein [Thermoanaerobaculia bacterium]
MKIVLMLAGAVIALIAIVLIVGVALPKRHTASRSALFKQDKRAVYAAVRDVASAAQWRDGVERIEVLDAHHFRERSRMGSVTYEITDDVPAERFSTRIVERDLGYSGSWTYRFEDVPGGSRLTITENGEVSNVFFRFMSRFVFGHRASIDAYLKALARRLA